MTKEKKTKKKKKKGGISEQGTLLAHYFCDNTGRTIECGNQISTKYYIRQVGAAKILLTKYTLEECKTIIDYIIKHPPRKGFTSLAYLNYVADDILKHLEYEQKLKKCKNNLSVELTNEADDLNKSKYKQNNKRKLKGIGGF